MTDASDTTMPVVSRTEHDRPDSVARFETAVTRNHSRFIALVYLLCGDPAAANDVVAETYLRVWPKYRSGRVHDLDGYLYRAVVRQAINRRTRRLLERRDVERRTIDWRVAESSNGFEESVLDRDLLFTELWKLPADQRAVIVLRHVEDKSESEVAQILGVRAGTVKSRLSRGLDALRATLEGELS